MPAAGPLVIAHRGAPGYRPEHSRAAYELAIAMGCDAVEPDVVPTKDGVLVVRHENEISGTTDVADRPEFAARRTAKTFLGQRQTGWFTEDFTWAELSTLKVRERLPKLRPGSAAHDGVEPMLRLTDVLAIAAAAPRPVGVVVEIKHDAYFRSIGFDLAELVDGALAASGWAGQGQKASTGNDHGSPSGRGPLTIESFEPGVLDRLRARGRAAQYVFLLEAAGAPPDLLAEHGADAPTYAQIATPAGLDRWASAYDGISVAKSMILGADATGEPGRALVAAAHGRGLGVFTWTCRPENAFLASRFRGPGGKAAFGDYAGEWALIRATGVDGFFADHTDLALVAFRG